MTRFILTISFLASCLFSHVVLAEGYWGAKVTQIEVDNPAFDNAYNAGIIVGAEFGTLGSNNIVSLEGEFSTTVIKGDVSTSEWDVQAFGLFAALRTGKDAYLKAKAGVVSWDLSVSPGTDTDDTALSYGFGGGFKLSSGHTLEIEYSVVEGDGGNADITMLGVNYLF